MTENDLGAPELAWFQHAPFGMLVIDSEGRIAHANRALESLVGLPASQLLGHTRDSLPSPTHRLLFADAGRIHLNGPGAPARWLECNSHQLADGTVRYYTEITRELELEVENRDLLDRIEASRVSDPLTGLPNHRAITQHLDLHISRSRRYGNALSIALVRMRLSLADASIHREAQDPALLAVSRYLRDRLRWVDQIARWDDKAFMVILPETDDDNARELLDRIAAEIDQLELPELLRHAKVELSVGVVGWQKGDDARTLVQRSERLAEPALASNG